MVKTFLNKDDVTKNMKKSLLLTSPIQNESRYCINLLNFLKLMVDLMNFKEQGP